MEKTLVIHLQEQRKQIAQDIENYYEGLVLSGLDVTFSAGNKFCFEEAASVARGKRK